MWKGLRGPCQWFEFLKIWIITAIVTKNNKITFQASTQQVDIHRNKNEVAYCGTLMPHHFGPWQGTSQQLTTAVYQTHHTGVLSHSFKHLQLVRKDARRATPCAFHANLDGKENPLTDWPRTAAELHTPFRHWSFTHLPQQSNVFDSPWFHTCSIPSKSPRLWRTGSNCCKLPLKASRGCRRRR